MVREAENAESRKDFVHKLSIAQKEANETLYWIELLKDTSYLADAQYADIHSKGTELIKILTAILKKLKSSNPPETNN